MSCFSFLRRTRSGYFQRRKSMRECGIQTKISTAVSQSLSTVCGKKLSRISAILRIFGRSVAQAISLCRVLSNPAIFDRLWSSNVGVLSGNVGDLSESICIIPFTTKGDKLVAAVKPVSQMGETDAVMAAITSSYTLTKNGGLRSGGRRFLRFDRI